MTGAGVSYDVGSWRLGDDGCIHRRGRMRFSNGDVYDGEWVDGKRHGKGTLRFANGSSYRGDFDANCFHGVGLLTIVRTQHPLTKKWIPGEKYDGEFRKGKKHGRGTFKTASGDTYDGDFQYDYYHGRGTCAYTNGDVYDGHWVRGKWHGHGELRRRDGSVYVGGLTNGEFHGYGKYSYGRRGTHGVYTGGYRFGQRHGKGSRIFGDGKRYDGDWRDDVIDGVGHMECDAFKYVGEFSGGVFQGHGVISYANGDSYEGGFVCGELHGDGRFVYADGGEYGGQFQASKKHGRGRRAFSTGDVYDGAWEHDRQHGRGVLERTTTKANGDTSMYHYDGEFEHGEQTGSATISFAFTPADVDDRFEWTDAYEFPPSSGFWHGGRGVTTYVGQVYRGAFHGHGELASPDGRRWCGHWRHGQLHGEAQCVYLPVVHDHLLDHDKRPLEKKKELMMKTTGLYRMVRYDGVFVENVRHGHGRVLFENGDAISGAFANGFAEGVVVYRFSTGKERFAEYERGQRKRWLSEHEECELLARQTAEKETEGRRQSVLCAMVSFD